MNWIHLLQQLFAVAIVLAVVVVPFMLGGTLARRLRMPDHGWKIGLCLCFVAVTVTALWHFRHKVKLGIDLSGGVTLIYEVDQQKKAQAEIKSVDMGELIAAVSRRVNPGGQKEVSIRQYGQEQVEIIIPNASEDEVKQLELTLGQVGSLQFRILATRRTDESLIDHAMAEKGDVVREKSGDKNSKVLGYWIPVNKSREAEFSHNPEIVTRVKQSGKKAELEVLVVKDPYDVGGSYLRSATQILGDNGYPAVSFTFNSRGGNLFGQLTSENLPDPAQPQNKRQLGIILDNYLYSAPNIQSAIHDQGQITGNFSQDEVKALVNVLNAGKLPAALSEKPIMRLVSGPTLGADTIHKSSLAMIISSILVPLFMIWYYRFAGIVAVIALMLNMAGLIAVMISINAPFTLTGLAGLALTIGMSVDNNVLINERLREELARGGTLRMAIRNAFARATTTIIDSKATTIIAGVVLYAMGSDQIKGFGIVLLVGVLISLFTGVFMARVMFDVAEKRQWRVLTGMRMHHLIHSTKIDFMSLFPYCAAASIFITVVGFLVAVYRGKNLFDIDFTGGVSVQMVFNQPHEIADIRKAMEKLDPDVTVTDVQMTGEQSGRRFVVDTSKASLDGVQDYLMKTFGSALQTNTLSITGLQPIAAAPAGASAVPTAEKPEAKPAESSAPKSTSSTNKQSRADLPGDNVLAYSTEVAQLLAADQPRSDATPALAPKPGEATLTAADSRAPPASTAATPSGAATTSPTNSAATTSPASSAATPAAATTTSVATTATPTVSVPVDPFAGGARVDLKLAYGINYLDLQSLIAANLPKVTDQPETVTMEIFNDAYEPGQAKPYDNWSVKIKLPPEKAQKLFDIVQQQLAQKPVFPASNAIGGAVASGTRWQAIAALVVSWIGIIIYLWVRFQHAAFGIAAVIALIHDVFVMLGALAFSVYMAPLLGFLLIEPFKINLPIVAAALTIVGYSVNDTIVVFDRIREVRGKDPNLTAKMINDSTNQTLSRTLLTSLTVFLVVIVLYIWGGQAIHGFAFALIVGVATGTYSSIYVAAPIVVAMVGKKHSMRAVEEDVKTVVQGSK
jgi:SecD/SecF fusion protein